MSSIRESSCKEITFHAIVAWYRDRPSISPCEWSSLPDELQKMLSNVANETGLVFVFHVLGRDIPAVKEGQEWEFALQSHKVAGVDRRGCEKMHLNVVPRHRIDTEKPGFLNTDTDEWVIPIVSGDVLVKTNQVKAVEVPKTYLFKGMVRKALLVIDANKPRSFEKDGDPSDVFQLKWVNYGTLLKDWRAQKRQTLGHFATFELLQAHTPPPPPEGVPMVE